MLQGKHKVNRSTLHILSPDAFYILKARKLNILAIIQVPGTP